MPFVVEAVSRPGISPEERRKIWNNVGRLDRTAAAPLEAVLESPDAKLAAEAATALGLIGDKRSIPNLTFAASSPAAGPAVRKAAGAAIGRITGEPFEAQKRAPVEVLTDAAWRLHRHQVDLGAEPVAIWTWDKEQNVPVSKDVPRTEAEAILGSRVAKDGAARARAD